MNSVTVGLYPNGSFKTNIVRPEHLAEHIEYNKNWRPGRALFVDGVCVNEGISIDKETIASWEEKLKTMKFDRSKSSEPYQ